ncbi:MAG: aminopeptidase P family protein [Planctomycetales bacterium]|nr:aminopeptidase P family protein [Planctomycetales bacterium]
MPRDRFAERRQKLVAGLKATEVEAMLVTNVTNVTYLTGFSGDSSFLLIGRRLAILISDGRYEIQLGDECPELETYIRPPSEKIENAAGNVLTSTKLKKVGIEADEVTVAQLAKFQELVPAAEFVSLEGHVEKLRQVKDAVELKEIREAIRQAEKAFAVMRANLRGDQTERQVAHDLEHTMRAFGAKGASFTPIVGVGARAALPHGRPTGVRISDADFVLVDWGSEATSGYKSDLTRVLVTGRLSPKLEKVYRLVLEAQRAGIAALRPGAKCCDVDAVARKVITDAGYGKHFNHGLGHGIGLDIHEGPRLSATSQTELQPGMIVTVEPGVYLPDWGGVRIEDDVLITADGPEVLTSVPKSWEEALVVV